MGGACSCGAKVEDEQSTKDRLGAPALPCSAPTRVRQAGTDGNAVCSSCAVRQSGADNPLVHSLSTAQLLEIHEAFSKFGELPASAASSPSNWLHGACWEGWGSCGVQRPL